MKGFFTIFQFPWVLLFLAFAVVVFFGSFFLFLSYQVPLYGQGSKTVTITFLDVQNEPANLALAFLQAKNSSRTFFEQHIESLVVGSTEKASAKDLAVHVRTFIDQYRLDFYIVQLIRGSDLPLFEVKNQITQFGQDVANPPKQCGQDLKGYCDISQEIFGTRCNVGYVELDSKGLCSGTEVCCTSDIDAYKKNEKTKNVKIVPCGSTGKGICSAKIDRSVSNCGNERKGEADSACTSTNGGETFFCCFEPQGVYYPVSSTTAEVPVFYKDIPASFIVVTVGR